jgi:formylglycine-generating enzyme required for sulfatase activity
MFVTEKWITVLVIVLLTTLLTSCSSGILVTNEKESAQNEKDGAKMVYIPAGEFLMGSSDEQTDWVLDITQSYLDDLFQKALFENEQPMHSVTLDAYWIYKTEVTNAQYRKCIQDGDCIGDLEDYPQDYYPAVFISWDRAISYCEWAGGRLPTEAEWEKAARGTDGRIFPWGEKRPTCDNEFANFGECNNGLTPVGSYPKGESPYGALDMAGNVWEWTADWADENYYNVSPSVNPTGPSTGDVRVLRGGSWFDDVWFLRASARWGADPEEFPSNLNGFRCVLSP